MNYTSKQLIALCVGILAAEHQVVTPAIISAAIYRKTKLDVPVSTLQKMKRVDKPVTLAYAEKFALFLNIDIQKISISEPAKREKSVKKRQPHRAAMPSVDGYSIQNKKFDCQKAWQFLVTPTTKRTIL